jgi:hypothetical protein
MFCTILYRTAADNTHAWLAWAGSKGIAVDPCHPAGFNLVFLTEVAIHQGEGFPGLGDVSWENNLPKYHADDCIVKSHDVNSPPTIDCGKTYAQDFKRRAIGGPAHPISCDGDIYMYERGWTVEY